jgi:nickel transport protein
MKLMWLKYFIALLLFLSVAPSASAHRVNVFARVDGDTVYVESKFPESKIFVMDPMGHELLSGLTDNEGHYSFKVPKRSDLRILLIAGQGHQAEWIIRANEIENVPESKTVQAAAEKALHSEHTETASNSSAEILTTASDIGIKPEELEAVIESVLDKKLKPIQRTLADMQQEGPGLRDILAGIGYILGLVGIGAYVHSRKKKG